MSLNHLFIFCFVFLGCFSILLMYLPAEFLVNTYGYTGASAQDKEAVDFFNANDMVVYNNTLALDNDTNPFLQYGTSQSFDFGLPSGQEIEFWWDLYTPYVSRLQIRHTNPGPFGWWTEYHILSVDQAYRITPELQSAYTIGLNKIDLQSLWNDNYNASYCSFSCETLTVQIFVFPYLDNITISESWDAGYLGIFTSYNVDWEAMKPGAFALLASLLLFQTPQLGITGIAGSIISYLIGIVLWASIVILAIGILSAFIPFIPGWQGG